MSRRPEKEPELEPGEGELVSLVIEARPKDVAGLTVRRSLPVARQRMVGPFVFTDHMGPATLAPGTGVDVPPHPHIGLATITYLFEGELIHRDSVGSEQLIRPGDVNWMVAGRGVVHSERSGPEPRKNGARLEGLQTWVALPVEQEEVEPWFEHHPLEALPRVERTGAELRVIAGTAYGARAPTGVLSPTLYVHARLETGAVLPVDDEHEERAVYVVRGTIACAGRSHGAGTMLVLRRGMSVEIFAQEAADVALLGGAPLPEKRHIWWNFVSTSKERIERAKDQWREGRFPKVPGDEHAYVPLPE